MGVQSRAASGHCGASCSDSDGSKDRVSAASRCCFEEFGADLGSGNFQGGGGIRLLCTHGSATRRKGGPSASFADVAIRMPCVCHCSCRMSLTPLRFDSLVYLVERCSVMRISGSHPQVLWDH